MKNKSFLLSFLFLFLWQVSLSQQTILSDSNLPIMVISTDIDPDTNAPTDIQMSQKYWVVCSLFIDQMVLEII